MRITSRTGLIPSPIKKIVRTEPVTTIQMAAVARPAPFILKPLAGLYNPFAPGCSLLCNHPTDIDVNEIIHSAKNSETTIKTTCVTTANIDVELNGEHLTATNIYIPQVESVPEELFRRYTDTDSRPQTPAPTLVSGFTRLSTSRTRRCVTPDPVPTCQIKEKKRLILDLRRSHSQETLSIYGNSHFYPDRPEIRIQESPSSSVSIKGLRNEDLHTSSNLSSTKRPGSVKTAANKAHQNNPDQDVPSENDEIQDDDGNSDFIKRRGKKRRKKTRDTSSCQIRYQASVEPETQVATIGPDSHNPSARHSLAPERYSPLEASPEELKKPKSGIKTSDHLEINSFLPKEILKQLRRELDDVVVDSELNLTRKKALEEALKTVQKSKPACYELSTIKKEMKIPPVNSELWISLPRIFIRSSAIFQLPMDSQTFETMSPLEYVEDNVNIISTRKLLYNCIFEKYKLETVTQINDDNTYQRQLDYQALKSCLDLIMGHALTEEQFNNFVNLIELKEDYKLTFKISCGIFALCERILAPQFCKLPSREEDPCHEMESADFEFLEDKLEGREISENLKTILWNLKKI